MQIRGHIARWIFVVLLSLAGAPALAADGQPPFDSLVTEALEAYRARDYDRAIARFTAAYEQRAEPELLYNIARSHERALRRREAIAMYERFLKSPGTTAELRAQALAAVEALKKEESAMERAAAADRPARTVSDTPAQNTPTTARTTAPAVREESHTLAWSLIGGGAAVAAAGGIVGILAMSSNASFDDATTPSEKLDLRDETKQRALIADVLIGVGVVAAAVGVVLRVTAPDGTSVAIMPTTGAELTGLAVGGTF
ncbi:hypothetical protein L6R52_31280 [Myxococcota bacterium]|nr:hypothetical protein [Myxococcota bacterium]